MAAKKAAVAEGLSLSAFLTKLIRAHVEQESKCAAMDRFVNAYTPRHRLTDEAKGAIEAEWTAPLKPVRSRRRKSAA